MQTQTDNQIAIEQFVRRNPVTMTCTSTDRNALMENSATMDHWKCTLRCAGRQMTLTFSKGSGHNGSEPTVHEVLDCLASDASGVSNSTHFEDWCRDYGYDTDSRKAEKIYDACVSQSAKLNNLLGYDAYQTLLWNTERL